MLDRTLTAIAVPGAARARSDLFEHPACLDRRHFLRKRVAVAGTRRRVPLLDQKPVVTKFPARAHVAIAHADQGPATFHALAVQFDLQVALFEIAQRRAFGLWLPASLVPELNGAAAIFALGNCSFEGAVVQRMILDLHRETLDRRIERRRFRHRPGFVDAVELEPEIEMQSRCVMALNDKAPRFSTFLADAAARLLRDREVALGMIGCKPG